ncbi:glycosyltransferase family 2 protein [Primorskyibacter sp. 2E107]|uniref:glycosyltransferase family 2 protein n=1 Tax=Primorskyibacter sp. 2E107 TaxID=3403458 RepID=UPI003AF78C39
MQSTAAALTMVRDDAFFLKAWLRHYGGILGRENCYVVNHGRGDDVARLAEGCNIIGIPGDPHKNFDMKRWRMLNNLVQGLRCYYNHVIVGDVDELVVLDPQAGMSLLEYLETAKPRRVLTPVGLEVVHRIDEEDQPIEDCIIGPRRHVRLAPHYSKPCILSVGDKIARGGHFTQSSKLFTPDELYLFHLKFCDFGVYSAAMDQRNRVTAELGGAVREIAIGRHWFAEARGEDRAVFEAFADLKVVPGFDLASVRQHMHATWKPRGETGFWQFDRPDYAVQLRLPDRFVGVI